jgi:hypothetical protein
MEKKLVSFRLPNDLMQDLKQRAEADGVSVTELVCRFSRQGLQTDALNFSYPTIAPGTATPSAPPQADIHTLERVTRLEERVDPRINDRVTRLETKLDMLMELVRGNKAGSLLT